MGSKSNRYDALKGASAVICWSVFLFMAVSQWRTFSSEPVGSSLKREKWTEAIPFPAISICDPHIRLKMAFDGLGVASNPFQKPKTVVKNPSLFYKTLDTIKVPISPQLWKYGFNLDDVIFRSTDKEGCLVGITTCTINSLDDEGRASFEAEERPVESGVWRSRLLADSSDGTTFFCHTLVPNVTIDFSKAGGNSISIRWQTGHQTVSTYWHVYVHDKNEDVILESYAMEPEVPIVVPGFKANPKEEEELKAKRKVLVSPLILQHPEPSEKLPCSNDDSYSENRCRVGRAWAAKFKAMDKAFGNRFTCRLPGTWPDPDDWHLPVCDHYFISEDNGTLGLFDLAHSEKSLEERPFLTGPPLGIYPTDCVRRCSNFR